MLKEAKAPCREGFHINVTRKGYTTMSYTYSLDFNLDYSQESIDFNQLNCQIKPHTLYLLKKLLPSGKLEKHEYISLNPTRNDKRAGSFRINVMTGKWADFATGDKGGDIISLWAYVNGTRQIDAARALQAIVGGV